MKYKFLIEDPAEGYTSHLSASSIREAKEESEKHYSGWLLYVPYQLLKQVKSARGSAGRNTKRISRKEKK
ncbi:hypothetical protein A2W67_03320 [Candidatus Nomurabacteria bacterium RIFCSPLOWO2_02_40_28]|nr:MAG: hypothetical protein UU07_C0033G0007 [Parcubacteria group bacterium GW2011_GWF1_40_5]OGI74059.1 MAG: hypothetical protein A2W50_02540 [Candidatus Nomurabacteria bacterium RIFCSPHIGHO2_02_40_30]OGI80392.1 MAG: hypothetical protein A2W43_03600 [Candidatus Nomurabacteria bacterium RIFCSPHIGHO2_12_40_11]OGI83112.1 MAG: hypothetical protein A3E33_02840 [Candidatus Nomurabacteria bacterium RIFCSPHIGHO2_12_FULL_40_77]OGI96301.1 MAG: hypothetical protein A2W67_03320 [Candidatus Nomurabacteria b